ncbi:hypothetical protein RFI_12092 [Reticulomyxa filosa]|uniref:Uncharacterized protein n=1 Tax=Reticulomyxa filosa TaxID=46433 RepID=X6NI72_RETFI|nr:hypothetical protein RFI_12092 [Reticulomyxa filosa]|eukprot:ETO25052.1 hypothetical protein RFI_12092 [Reticulomyxa filosa]
MFCANVFLNTCATSKYVYVNIGEIVFNSNTIHKTANKVFFLFFGMFLIGCLYSRSKHNVLHLSSSCSKKKKKTKIFIYYYYYYCYCAFFFSFLVSASQYKHPELSSPSTHTTDKKKNLSLTALQAKDFPYWSTTSFHHRCSAVPKFAKATTGSKNKQTKKILCPHFKKHFRCENEEKFFLIVN